MSGCNKYVTGLVRKDSGEFAIAELIGRCLLPLRNKGFRVDTVTEKSFLILTHRFGQAMNYTANP